MMKPRLYVDAHLEIDLELILDPEHRHYLINTLRRKQGSEVLLFNGAIPECEWEAVMVQTHPDARLLIGKKILVKRESTLSITLVAGLLKGDAMEWSIQKAAELGVVRFIPLLTQRTVARLPPERWPAKEKRWKKIIQESAEQCERVRLMEIHPPMALPQLSAIVDQGRRYLFWEEESASLPRLTSLKPSGTGVTVITGSEGGFTTEEVQLARQQLGCDVVTLGPRIVRAETAALAVVVAMQTLWGDMG
ncbi:MAG: 16S rRNA (uracil(1498)-N(3))-methyltransferase [Magnetococcales bacterium]|nr:16S rRNA (uracil(1498)-N(3))-methyltransferase [Magnetococcales bacterium]